MHVVQTPTRPEQGFASLAKHDLSAKLRTTNTLVGFIREDLGEDVSTQTAAHLDMIVERNEQMESLLKALFEFERAAAPADNDAPQPVHLDHLVANVCSAIDVPRDVSIMLDIDPVVCSIDETAVHTCLDHIIRNAVQHRSSPSGFVRVSVSHSKSYIEMLVEDDGAGIPPEHIDVACEPLRKLSYPGHADTGHGLGLAIVGRITTAHRAQLRIGSRPSVGSSVRLSWPTSAASPTGFRADEIRLL